MNSKELRNKFLSFFKEKGHTIIPSASLIPENDPTVLFTTAGMHPLVPFLLGEKHPGGERLANAQPCLRTDDIDEVGDETHHTFFEMLGNWSLGDYFKEETIKFSLEFLINPKWLGLEKEKLAISIFAGNEDAPRDEESEKIWLSLGIPQERIKGLPKKDNWWGPAGETGPCGPDTEMFYWSAKEKVPKEFDPRDKRWVEIWNDVFMQYFRDLDGRYELLSQKNVDTGMGLERTLSIVDGLEDNYRTDVFWPLVKELEDLSGRKYEDSKKEFRIIADHVKAAVFIVGDVKGVEPSNVGQGYVARRLIRRAIRYGKILNLSHSFFIPLVERVIEIYEDFYPEVKSKKDYIVSVISKEEEKFEKTLEQGLREIIKIWEKKSLWKTERGSEPLEDAKILGTVLFDVYQSFGVPLELSIEELMKLEDGQGLSEMRDKIKEGFNEELKKHQDLSRTASAGMFKGGLADQSLEAVKYHTATHLLLAALRQVLGIHVSQKGSNINTERLRFDFSHPQKMTEEELKKVEEIVNQKIKENLEVVCQEMNLSEAREKNVAGVFENKYGEQVKTYTIGEFSKEICGGPHVKTTGELGRLKIIKEESSSSGVRRIKAILQKE